MEVFFGGGGEEIGICVSKIKGFFGGNIGVYFLENRSLFFKNRSLFLEN